MICTNCLRSARPLRPFSSITRTFSTSWRQLEPSTQPVFSNPLTPPPGSKSKAKVVLPESSCPAGTSLKGLNYFKGKDDPVALAEEEYPQWLWHCLDAKVKDGDESEAGAGDEFSKSKKSRRLAAKRQRKLEEQMVLSGNTEAFAPKVPITAQSIDLPANKEGSVRGALEAEGKREEVRKAMRQQRRKDIKERNFLGSM